MLSFLFNKNLIKYFKSHFKIVIINYNYWNRDLYIRDNKIEEFSKLNFGLKLDYFLAGKQVVKLLLWIPMTPLQLNNISKTLKMLQ